MARDGMTGALNYNIIIEMAKINGIVDENLEDLIDFINECEDKRLEKKQKEEDR